MAGGEPGAAGCLGFVLGLLACGGIFLCYWGLPETVIGWVGFGFVALIGAGVAVRAAAGDD
jgi:hypothetical protein